MPALMIDAQADDPKGRVDAFEVGQIIADIVSQQIGANVRVNASIADAPFSKADMYQTTQKVSKKPWIGKR